MFDDIFFFDLNRTILASLPTGSVPLYGLVCEYLEPFLIHYVLLQMLMMLRPSKRIKSQQKNASNFFKIKLGFPCHYDVVDLMNVRHLVSVIAIARR